MAAGRRRVRTESMDRLGASLAMLAGIAAAGLQALGFVLIAVAVMWGSVRPNRYSWLIWSVVAALAAASSWQAGATWPLAGAAMNALGCIVILVLALRRGCDARNRTDTTCLAVAVAGVALWLLTDEPVVGLLFFLLADASGAVPTIRGVAADPFAESAVGWSILALAGAAAVLSVEAPQWVWSWEGFGHWGGAVYVALVNLAIVSSIGLARLGRRLAASVGRA